MNKLKIVFMLFCALLFSCSNYVSDLEKTLDKDKVSLFDIYKNYLENQDKQKAPEKDKGKNEETSKKDESEETDKNPDENIKVEEKAAYFVEHYRQSPDKSEYVLIDEDTESLSGTVGALTEAESKSYEGFLPKKFKQETIDASGKTVVKIYYDYSSHIIYDLDDGSNSEQNPAAYIDSYLPVKLESAQKEGFVFYGWLDDGKNIVTEIPEGVSGDINLKALWCLEDESYYVVCHNIQSLDDENSYEQIDKDYKVGKKTELTQASANEIYGFTPKNIEQKTVSGTELTVTNVYYDRNTYETHFTYIFDDTGSGGKFTLSGKYQQKIEISEDCYSNDYTIGSFSPSDPQFFGEEIKDYTILLESKYEYFQNINSKGEICIPIVVRDFRMCSQYYVKGKGDGFITEEHRNLYGDRFIVGCGHPDFYIGNTYRELIRGIVQDELDSEGKPVFLSYNSRNPDKEYVETYSITKESYDMWYRDYLGLNRTIYGKEIPFSYDSNDHVSIFSEYEFFPIDNEGFGNNFEIDSGRHNWGFTTEISVYYLHGFGGETIEICGDDTFWVFLDGELVLDFGGIHSGFNSEGSIRVLGSSNIEIKQKLNYGPNAYDYSNLDYYNEREKIYYKKHKLIPGQYVELKIFHAERCSPGSSLKIKVTGPEIYSRKLKEKN